MNVIATPNHLPDLTEATERANKWIGVARPIIKAMFLIEDEHLLGRAWLDAHSANQQHHMRTFEEAQSYLEHAHRELFQMLDGIRDDFLCDECPPQPSQDADERLWQERDEFCDALAESVTTVDQAIKIVTGEHNRSFGL